MQSWKAHTGEKGHLDPLFLFFFFFLLMWFCEFQTRSKSSCCNRAPFYIPISCYICIQLLSLRSCDFVSFSLDPDLWGGVSLVQRSSFFSEGFSVVSVSLQRRFVYPATRGFLYSATVVFVVRRLYVVICSEIVHCSLDSSSAVYDWSSSAVSPAWILSSA